MKNESANNKEKKPFFTPKRVFLGVLSLGVLGFGFWYATRRTSKPGSDGGIVFDESANDFMKDTTKAAQPQLPVPTNPAPKSTPRIVPQSDFPLKKGSRGEKVMNLQRTLLAKYPGSLKSGADGVFGSETHNALAAKGLPTEISESQYNVLTAIDPARVAENIYQAAKKKDFRATMSALGNIQNTDDYQAVNEKFKPKRLLHGSSTTIVTGLLETFTSQSQKDQLNVAFASMGLEKKDGKWFIPGVSGVTRRKIMTIQPAKVWQNAKHMVQVGAHTILGYEVQSGDGITVFDTIDGYRLYVATHNVKYN
jgi:hypothetical protein